jgi:hypothetical protein
MSEQYVEQAKQKMNALERLLKGLPGISGYVDRELRRDADKRLREVIANGLEEQKQALLEVQRRLLSGGGLSWLDDVDRIIQKLQLLIDRIRTASYGYAGLFDAVRIRQEELDALHRFDVALAGRAAELQGAVSALAAGAADQANLQALSNQLSALVTELNTLFHKRSEAIVSPDLLTNPDYAPTVDLPADPTAGAEGQS